MADEDSAAQQERFHIFSIDGENGRQDIVSLLSPEAAIEGGIPPEAIVGVLRKTIEDGGRIEPENFVASQTFVDFLHMFIAQSFPMMPGVQERAEVDPEGYLYVLDHRTPTPEGHVPTEDIIGAFQVVDGAVSSAQYEPMGTHLLLTDNGFFDLGHTNMDMLIEMLIRCCQASGM